MLVAKQSQCVLRALEKRPFSRVNREWGDAASEVAQWAPASDGVRGPCFMPTVALWGCGNLVKVSWEQLLVRSGVDWQCAVFCLLP